MANEENLRPWKPGVSGNIFGRPKKITTIINGLDVSYTKSEIRATISCIAALTRKEVNELLDNEDLTVLEVVICKAFKRAMKSSNYGAIKDLIELIADKPIKYKPRAIEVNNRYSNLSIDELQVRVNALR